MRFAADTGERAHIQPSEELGARVQPLVEADHGLELQPLPPAHGDLLGERLLPAGEQGDIEDCAFWRRPPWKQPCQILEVHLVNLRLRDHQLSAAEEKVRVDYDLKMGPSAYRICLVRRSSQSTNRGNVRAVFSSGVCYKSAPAMHRRS